MIYMPMILVMSSHSLKAVASLNDAKSSLEYLKSFPAGVAQEGLQPDWIFSTAFENSKLMDIYVLALKNILATKQGQSFCQHLGEENGQLAFGWGVLEETVAKDLKPLCKGGVSKILKPPFEGAFYKSPNFERNMTFVRTEKPYFLWGWTNQFNQSYFVFDVAHLTWESFLRTMGHELSIIFDAKAKLHEGLVQYLTRPDEISNDADYRRRFLVGHFVKSGSSAQSPHDVFQNIEEHAENIVRTCDVLSAIAIPEIRMATAALRAWQVEDNIWHEHAETKKLKSNKPERTFLPSDNCETKLKKTAQFFGEHPSIKEALDFPILSSSSSAEEIALPTDPISLCRSRWMSDEYIQLLSSGDKKMYLNGLQKLKGIDVFIRKSGRESRQNLCEFLIEPTLLPGVSQWPIGPHPRIPGGTGD